MSRQYTSSEEQKRAGYVMMAIGGGLFVILVGAICWMIAMGKSMDAGPASLLGLLVVVSALLLMCGVAVAFPNASKIILAMSNQVLKAIPGRGGRADETEGEDETDPTETGTQLPVVLEADPLQGKEAGPSVAVEEQVSEIDRARECVFDAVGPIYLLDSNFHFLDWNPAFDEVIAKPLKLRRGNHVDTFIARLANWKEVVERSRRIFNEKGVPTVDTEILVIETEEWGTIELQKVACQLNPEDGNKSMWSVALEVMSADDVRQLYRRIRKRLEDEVSWRAYAAGYDPLLGNFPEYQELMREVVDAVGGARLVLDLGAGTGNGALKLLEDDPQRKVWTVESSEAMIRILKQKLRAAGVAGRATILKGDMTRLVRVPDGVFDAVIMVNSFYALGSDDEKKTHREKRRCLAEVYRVLKPGGVFVMTTSHTETDLDGLLGKLDERMREKGIHEDVAEDLQRAHRFHEAYRDRILHDTRDEIRQYVEGAGFDISAEKSAYADAVVLLRGVRKAQTTSGIVVDIEAT